MSKSEVGVSTVSPTSPPRKRARWMYASGKSWATFQEADDQKLEAKWTELGGEQWTASLRRKQMQIDEESETAESSDRPKRPSYVKSAPSGIDSIRSALDCAVHPPDKGKGKTDETVKEATVSPSKPWLVPLRSLGLVSQSNDQSEDKQGGEDADSKQDNTDEDGNVHVNHILDPDEPEENRRTRVEVMEDNLFDVDLETMTLYPVFWKGVLLKVVRATWFYSSLTDGSYVPISADDSISEELDTAYEKAQSWLCSNAKLSTKELSAREQDKGTLYPLPSMQNEGQVSFQDAEIGRIFSQDLRGRAMSMLGGSIVVRGFDRAEQIAREESFNGLSSYLPWASNEGNSRAAGKQEGVAQTDAAPRSGGGADGPNESQKTSDGDTDVIQSFATKLVPSSDALMRPIVALKKLLGLDPNDAADEEKRKMKQKTTENDLDRQQRDNEEELLPDDRKDEPPELVFAIHGIGQQLTEDFEALDFVYDVEHLRTLAGKSARDPAVRRLSRGRRAQFLPICWRKLVEFDDEPEENDNCYTLSDITNSAAIPMVRNVISKVVLDVPFYLSRHREKMIRSVIQEVNRTYRLFCRRNPEFERRGGRVNLIGHSLGSALAADILSAQPTKVPSLFELEGSGRHEDLKDAKHLHFNVKNVFFIGSPVAFFFYLDGGQLIARSGTERNPDGDADAVSSEEGKYGCLAVESVYNIFNPNDPVAFQLSPTADAAYASLVQPISIAAAGEALLRSLALPRISVSRIFEKYGDHPFAGVGQIVRQARIWADENDPQIPKDLTKEQKQQVQQRKLGRKIVEDSDYIQKVSKMQHMDTQRRSEQEQPSSHASRGAATLLTEAGSRQKSLQPERALREAESHGLISGDHSKFDLDNLERAQRRFRALNPHGCIDYHLSATISLSGYLDMLTAHVAYWSHPDFATFILTQLFMNYQADDEVTLVPQIQLQSPPSAGNTTEQGQESESEQEN